MIFFSMGKITLTPQARCAITRAGQRPYEFLARHKRNDWGDVDADRHLENTLAVIVGEAVVSAYRTACGELLLIATAGDRQETLCATEEELCDE